MDATAGDQQGSVGAGQEGAAQEFFSRLGRGEVAGAAEVFSDAVSDAAAQAAESLPSGSSLEASVDAVLDNVFEVMKNTPGLELAGRKLKQFADAANIASNAEAARREVEASGGSATEQSVASTLSIIRDVATLATGVAVAAAAGAIAAFAASVGLVGGGAATF